MSRHPKQQAFTIIEVIAALAVVSIALTALLRLQLGTIGLCDRAEVMLQATQLAQVKLSEAQAQGYPPLGTSSGVDERQGRALTWRMTVSQAKGLPVAPLPSTGLRTLSVQVAWGHGSAARSLTMERMIASRVLP